MTIRFFNDPDTELPHIYGHNVTENEVREVLRKPYEEFKGQRNSIIALGQTLAGRYLKVIYSRDRSGDDIFVITAYDLAGTQLKALRRRIRRRPK